MGEMYKWTDQIQPNATSYNVHLWGLEGWTSDG